MKDAPIEFRTKTDEPTVEGWYHARRHGSKEIEPVEVVAQMGGFLCVLSGGVSYKGWRHQFDWFGPVHEVREG